MWRYVGIRNNIFIFRYLRAACKAIARYCHWSQTMSATNRQHHVEIEYCTQCHWLMRSAWMAQELLTTFESDIAGLTLVPGTGGIFEVRLDGEAIFSRKLAGRFPESKELKQLIRDRIDPERSLGHSDRKD
jgi:selenoprotein W-related protein